MEQFINGLTQGSIYALIALGYTMVYGVLRLINFAHGDVYMLGAFFGLFAANAVARTLSVETSPLITLAAFAVAMIGAALAGMLIERVAYRPLRGAPRLTLLITAIGVSMLLEYGGQMVFGATARGFPSLLEDRTWERISITPAFLACALNLAAPALAWARRSSDPAGRTGLTRLALTFCALVTALSFVPAFARAPFFTKAVVSFANPIAAVSALQVTIVATSVTLMLALQFIVQRTKIGRAMRAVSLDRAAASLMGINTNTVIAWTFALGSALAAAGGVLTGIYQPTITPLIGIAVGLKAFVAAVVGGIGNIPGAMLGGLLLGFAETFVIANGGSAYSDAIAFAILIVVLLVRPAGLMGRAVAEKV